MQSLTSDYQSAILASYRIGAYGELYHAMTQLAALIIQQGDTQKASDILAFILLQDDVPDDIHGTAFDLFDELERSICPRVIWDAREFAKDMDVHGMVEHILDTDLEEVE